MLKFKYDNFDYTGSKKGNLLVPQNNIDSLWLYITSDFEILKDRVSIAYYSLSSFPIIDFIERLGYWVKRVKSGRVKTFTTDDEQIILTHERNDTYNLYIEDNEFIDGNKIMEGNYRVTFSEVESAYYELIKDFSNRIHKELRFENGKHDFNFYC